jgi:hypothetical protein
LKSTYTGAKNVEKIEHTPTPWTLERDRTYATIKDANGDVIPMFTDIELGWTDTTTGPYASPEDDLALLEHIVLAANLHDDMVQACKFVRGLLMPHKCIYHGPMICDTCAAVKQIDAVLSRAAGKKGE